jgi:predicted nucleotidyltransferase
MRTINDIQPPPVAVEYAREVRNRLGNHVRQIILFGSQARGDATERSDYDFIVVVDERTRALREALLDAGGRLMDEREELCAAVLYDADEWETARRSPLGWNVEREGVLL